LLRSFFIVAFLGTKSVFCVGKRSDFVGSLLALSSKNSRLKGMNLPSSAIIINEVPFSLQS
jgi:hypothetical protein